MNELNYTPLSDGFKVAKNDDGNVVFARNDTTLFVASPADLQSTLAPMIGSITAVPAADTTALDAANASVAQLQTQLAAAQEGAVNYEKQIEALKAQIAADKAAAATIQGTGTAGLSEQSVVATASPDALAPTIAPSNTGITGS